LLLGTYREYGQVVTDIKGKMSDRGLEIYPSFGFLQCKSNLSAKLIAAG